MRLCTFEVATPIGRHRRLGAACDNGRIADLNFATAWYMAQTGEAEPQRLADALVPANMTGFLRTGLRALFTAEELFLGAGPDPHDWWERDPLPEGPNGETLAYAPEKVRLRAPLPNALIDPEDPAAVDGECQAWVAGITGATGVVGYTIQTSFGAMGPYIVTPDDLDEARDLVLRVNGEERGRATWDDGAARIAAPVAEGELVEIEAAGIGVLRNRIVGRNHVPAQKR